MKSVESYKAVLASMAKVIDNNGIEGYLSPFYSGRFMYGSTCLGVVMEGELLTEFKLDLNDYLSEEIKSFESAGDEDTAELLAQFKQAIRGPSHDNMGLDMIEYYRDFSIPDEYREELSEYAEKLKSY